MPVAEPTAGAGLIAQLVRDGGRPFRYRAAVARLVGLRPPEVQAIARVGRYGAPVLPTPVVRRARTFQAAAAERTPVTGAPRVAAVSPGAAHDGAAARDAAPRAASAPPVAPLSGSRTMTPAGEPAVIAGIPAAAIPVASTVTGTALAMPAVPAGPASEPPRSIHVPAARVARVAPPAPATERRTSAPPAPATAPPSPEARSALAIAVAGAAPRTRDGSAHDQRAERTPASAPRAPAPAPPLATAPLGAPGAPSAITVAELTAIRAMASGGAAQLPARTAAQAALGSRIDLAALAAGQPLRSAQPPLAASAPRAPVTQAMPATPMAPLTPVTPVTGVTAVTAIRPPIVDARLHSKIAELTREVAALRQGQREAAAAPPPRPTATAPAAPQPAPRSSPPSDTAWARRHAGARRFRVGRG